MPHSLRVRLKKIYEKGLDHCLLTDKDVERLIHALDVVDAIDNIKTEIPTLSHWQSDDGQDLAMVADVLECIDKHISGKERMNEKRRISNNRQAR